jgi:hypothetical protein
VSEIMKVPSRQHGVFLKPTLRRTQDNTSFLVYKGSQQAGGVNDT